MEYYKLKTIYWYRDIHILVPRTKPMLSERQLLQCLAMTRAMLSYY